MKQKRSKAIDVCFYWLRDCVQQGQFYVYWDSGKHNMEDFYTTHHPPAYHKKMRPIHTYIEGVSPESFQGCIKLMNSGNEKKTTKSKSPILNGLLASSKQIGCMAARAPSEYSIIP